MGLELDVLCPSLFRGLEAARSEALSEHMRFSRFSNRALLFRAGDVCERFYVVETGHVCLSRSAASGKEIATCVLGPGDVLGECALLGEAEHSLTARALGPAAAWSFSAFEVLRLAERDPTFFANLARIAHDRLLRIFLTLEDVACAHVAERLLRLLERISVRHGVATNGGRYVGVDLTHADLAMLVGASRETVSSTLSVLSRRGALEMRNRKICLIDENPAYEIFAERRRRRECLTAEHVECAV